MEKKPQQPKAEPFFPPGKSLEELLLSSTEEIEQFAAKANVSADKYLEILVAAIDKRNEAVEKALAQKYKAPEKPVDERAENIRKEILAAFDQVDFFALDKAREDADVLEDRAFSSLNKIEDEKDEQVRRYLADQAEALFRESRMSWAGQRVKELVGENKTFQEALRTVADELRDRAKDDNVQERSQAAQEVARMLFARAYNEEMFRDIEQLRKAYRTGNPNEQEQALMRRLVLAARGEFLTSALSAESLNRYGVSKFAPIIRNLGRAYKRAAGFDLSQNNGALGSIEKFDLDMPNSYDSQGSPRSRPRRSSIPEERY